MPENYDFNAIEAKWQERWLTDSTFSVGNDTPGKKMYVLDMFPYPSGEGLHVGHVKIYTASDIVSRYLRMKGFAVLHPTGWDAFGLPTENSAIKFKIHPAELTKRNVDRFRKQMQRLGFSYDWKREINTSDPSYYKWTQWIFLQLFKMGLAYEATAPINWCPKDQTGLANEEVIDGKCERCGTEVEEKMVRQWMLKITKYAEELLKGTENLDWPQFIKELQHNWIGKSEGTEFTFVLPTASQKLNVFTTRADTLFGVTYLVLSPNHPLLTELTTPEQQQIVANYVEQARKSVKLKKEKDADKEKTGVFTGSYASHPLTGEQLPIWVADYVLSSYGMGAVMAVPAHDERDFAFAQKYNLPVKQVIIPKLAGGEVKMPYLDEGVLINSAQFDGQETNKAREAITQFLQLKQLAKKSVHYKLRDWVFSRQRYWGEPIPLIHCEKCGIVPVPEKDLPVKLPEVTHYEPTGTGESPLAAIPQWVNVKCPNCPNMGKRETNTMPQWAGSSWYWLRYPSPEYTEALADPASLKKWLPVDVYVGGAEHAVLHLLYARFWHKALFDQGLVSQNEPFFRFRAVGLVMGQDGQKMSKSRGNVVNPDDMMDKYGADALRVYEMFMGPFDAAVAWNEDGIKGASRFLERIWHMINRLKDHSVEVAESNELILQLQATIKHVSESTEQFKFNTAISGLMKLLNTLEERVVISKQTLDTFVLLLAPYVPHVAEELWVLLGHNEGITYQPWPLFNDDLLSAAVKKIPVQVNGRVRGTVEVPGGSAQELVQEKALLLENVAKYISGKEVVKVVFVPDRLLNIVIKDK